jgi:hypothetical protein
MSEMALLPKSKLWRTIVVLGGFILLAAIFYAEENWRGKRAWENCKRELEAKGEILDWDKLIPPPVPNDQNFFKAPKMQEWFVKNWHSETNELADRLHDTKFQATTASVNTVTNLIHPPVAKSFELESATWCWTFKNLLRKYPNDPSLWQNLKHFRFPWGNYMPSGWVYQNMVTIANLQSKLVDSTDFENGTILPEKIETERRQAKEIHNHFSFYTFLARFATDADLSKIWQTTAHNQTLVNEGQIACALERYHLAQGEYPETLDALAPQFSEIIPRDIIGGQPLHYGRTSDGKFSLYSVGWNKTDDGGNDGGSDFAKGDWVWKN